MNCPRMLLCALTAVALLSAGLPQTLTAADQANTSKQTPASLQWHESYLEGYQAAQKAEQDFFIFFYDPTSPSRWEQFSTMIEADAKLREQLAGYTLAKVSLEEKNTIDDSCDRMIQHGAFSEMQGGEGIAILDLSHVDAPYYAYVVSLYPYVANPFAVGGSISKYHLRELLNLPAGTLTQRTMVFAVRVHQENPVSADSTCCTVLLGEAQKHSKYQAAIVDQGHHNWSSRFHSINAQLTGGLTAQEVVAESWPGENMMQAAKECVYSWRRSPGHWNGVRSRNDRFAYDMKRGRNGIWYATGLFARRR